MSTDNTNGALPDLEESLSQPVTETPVVEVPAVAATPVTEPTDETKPDDTPGDTEDSNESEEEGSDEQEDTGFNFPARESLNNAEQQFETFAEIKDWDDGNITLPIAPETAARVSEYSSNLPNIDLTSTEKGREWVDTLNAGMESGVFRDYAGGAAQRPEAQWRQSIKVGAKVLMGGRPKIDNDGPKLTGERGVMRVNAHLGRGSVVTIPLWHSGFWITIKAPMAARLLEMFQRMSEEKIMLGRATHGLAFANHTVFTSASLIDLVIEHIFEHSIKDVPNSQLRDMINILDINSLAWGLACANWPRGFQYTRSILDPKGRTFEVVKEKLNVAYLHWLDTTSIDEYQRNHMANRTTGSMSKIAVETYREHFTRGKPKTYELKPGVNVTFAVPFISEYLTTGQMWVNETAAMINSAFTDEDNLEARNKKILDQARATSMRQFGHWVKSFEFPELNQVMDEPATVALQCNSFSDDDEIRTAFFKAVREYQEDSTIAIIATPLVSDNEKDRTLPRFPWLLQMDPISTFFTLLGQKVYQIQQRL